MKHLFLGGLLLLFATPAFAEMLTFDDITNTNIAPIPSGYGGFNWTELDLSGCLFVSYNCPSSGNAIVYKYPSAAVSGDYVLHTVAFEMNRADGGTFSLFSAYAKPQTPGLIEDFEVVALRNSTVVQDVTFRINGSNPPSLLTLGFNNVDRVRFFATAADTTLMDNVNVSVPESPTLSLLAVGLLAIAATI